MTIQTIGLLGVFGLLVLMLLRVPVGVSLALVGLAGYAAIDSVPSALAVLSFTPLQIVSEHALSVVPLFTLMGLLCARMGLSQRLYSAAAAAFGTVRGSSALATLGASAAFGAMNGSSLASCLTIGRIAVPEMRAQGYRDSLISGSIAAGGTLGILLPPSIVLVVYALITEQSVGRLFAAGIVPGILLTLLYFGAVATVLALDPAAAPRGASLALRDRLRALGSAWEAVVLFGGTIGGIYVSLFTPTEAAAIGVALTLAIGFARGTLDISSVRDALTEATVLSAVLFLVLLGSTYFSYFVVQAQLPQATVDWLTGLGLTPLAVLLMIVVFYVLAGIVLDGIGLVLATVPIVYPVVVSLGFDPVWFGVLLVLMVEIGLLSPPVGMNLFVMKSVAPNLAFRDIYAGVVPFLIGQALLVAILIAVPAVATWLPGVLYR